LDEASAQRLLAVIRRFAASHTVILITHDPRVVAAADTILHLAPALAPTSARSGPSTSTSTGTGTGTGPARASGHAPQLA